MLGKQVFFRYFHETYNVKQAELLSQLASKNDQVICTDTSRSARCSGSVAGATYSLLQVKVRERSAPRRDGTISSPRERYKRQDRPPRR